MDPIFNSKIISDIITLIGALIRLLGMAGIGLGIGWLVLELLRKGQQAWQLQIAVFLGLAGLIGALVNFLYWNAAGALGMFGIGICAALLIWGMPKKKKEEKED